MKIEYQKEYPKHACTHPGKYIRYSRMSNSESKNMPEKKKKKTNLVQTGCQLHCRHLRQKKCQHVCLVEYLNTWKYTLCQNVFQIESIKCGYNWMAFGGVTGLNLWFRFFSNMVSSPSGSPPESVSSRLWLCRFLLFFRHLRGRTSPKLGRNWDNLEVLNMFSMFSMALPWVSLVFSMVFLLIFLQFATKKRQFFPTLKVIQPGSHSRLLQNPWITSC